MTDAAKKIYDEVSMLASDERAELVEWLYEDFGPRDANYEEAWAAEIQQRLDDLRSGKTKAIPWEEVRADLGLPPRGS